MILPARLVLLDLGRPHLFIAFVQLPASVLLRGQIPRPGYPENPKTVGEHIRKVRMDRGLMQKDVATIIGASTATLCNWENGRAVPQTHFWGQIVEFLAFEPWPEPQTLPERLLAFRRTNSLTQEKLAELLDADESTVQQWEAGLHEPVAASWRTIVSVLGLQVEKPETLSEALVAFRRARGLSQRALAFELGLAATTMSGWETGRKRPSEHSLRRLELAGFSWPRGEKQIRFLGAGGCRPSPQSQLDAKPPK